MDTKSTIFLVLSAMSIITIAILLNTEPEVPIVLEKYWGPGLEPPKESSKVITPMNITFSDAMIEDLKHRLGNTRYTPPLEGVAQEYGFNTNLLKEIVDFWKTKYPFKEREAYLNKYPQFVTNIQGLDIHFLHVKPQDTQGLTVLPLLAIHGWPVSNREFYDMIPLLTTRNPKHNFVFEVIAPSLPGFGYSQAAAKPGCGALEMSLIMKNLMQRLGHDKFYVHGGDWGSNIGAYMGMLYKQNVLGIHCNLCFVSTPMSSLKRLVGSLYPPMIVEEAYADRYYPLGYYLKELLLESGHFHLQATKPDTIGVGLTDSPAGLVAYILEKFTTGTNLSWRHRADGGLQEAFDYVDLLDNIMIYWATQSITTSMRIYSESLSILNTLPVEVPSACTNFRYEIGYTPESVLRDRYLNLVQNTHYDHGGHFVAMELPKELSKDIFIAVGKMVQQRTAKMS